MSTKAASKPLLLWIDLSCDQVAEQCIEQFAAQCRIVRADGLDSLADAVAQTHADMLCLQFDRPDDHGLHLLLEIKRRFAALPITMLTLQHSEELAVWAFRAGVWDYLVLPLSSAERLRYLKALHALHELRLQPAGPAPRQRLARVERLPECVRLNRGAEARQPLHAALAHIDSHFRERIEEREMAELCRMSVVRFSRLFKQSCGIGFQEYVMGKRMQAAEDLLLNSDTPIAGIAGKVGFKDPSYFARAFRQHFGHSPSSCRQARQQADHLPPAIERASAAAAPPG
jgi:AraC-like DNA-binding protein